MVRKLAIAAVGVPALSLTLPAIAQEAYPARPMRLIVGFAAGGGTDTVARVVAQDLSSRLGQQMVVENRAGAGGAIGTTVGAQSKGDGYTLVLGSSGTMVVNPLLDAKLQYNVQRDFIGVAGIVSVPYLVVAYPQFAADLKSAIERVRAQPGTVMFASPGTGTTNHLVGVLLQSMTGTSLVHVPYRGAPLAMNDVIAGRANFMSGDLATVTPMVNAGRLKPLAITGPKRVPSLPDVPTVAETLPGFEATGWFAMFAPKSTPRAIADRLATAIGQALDNDAVTQKLAVTGGLPMRMTSDQLERLVASEMAKWRKIITDNKVTLEAETK